MFPYSITVDTRFNNHILNVNISNVKCVFHSSSLFLYFQSNNLESPFRIIIKPIRNCYLLAPSTIIMIFITFLNRFDLRTGCLSISVLHMSFIITSLHIPLHTGVKTRVDMIMVIEKFFEMFTTIAQIYAIFNVSTQ